MTLDILTAVATIALALAAFFTIARDEIRYFFWHPDFDVRFQPDQPDCHRVRLDWRHGDRTGSAETHYVRCRIKNTGKIAARDVEVAVIEVLRKNAAGKFDPYPMGTPWALVWAHRNDPRLLPHVLEQIPVGTERHIAIGHVVDPAKRAEIPGENDPSRQVPDGQTLFCLQFFVKSNTGEYLLDKGEYKVRFQVAASNAKPRELVFLLNHTGQWFEDEKRMYTEGLGLEIKRTT